MASKVGDFGIGPGLPGLLFVVFQTLSPCLLLDLLDQDYALPLPPHPPPPLLQQDAFAVETGSNLS